MTTQNTSNTTLLANVIDQLENKLFCDLVQDYNDMADAYNYERIYDNDEMTLNDYFTNPYDAIRQTNHEGYNDNDDYFIVNGYGHLNSFSYSLDASGCPIDIGELAQWIIDNESYNEYDIEVTTIDDMLASIEDNITDDEDMLLAAIEYHGIDINADDSNDDMVFDVMYELHKCDYIDLQNTINRLGINI